MALLTPSGATKSGLVRPSTVGPYELNDSMVVEVFQYTAPVDIAEEESAGTAKLPDATRYAASMDCTFEKR
ncbi:hypothetical protein ACFLYL_02810 [Chloroflexota bacterium]